MPASDNQNYPWSWKDKVSERPSSFKPFRNRTKKPVNNSFAVSTDVSVVWSVKKFNRDDAENNEGEPTFIFLGTVMAIGKAQAMRKAAKEFDCFDFELTVEREGKD